MAAASATRAATAAAAATPRRASSSSASSPSTACRRSSRAVVASASPRSSSSVTATAWSASATARPARCPTAISKGVEEAKKNFFRVPRVGADDPAPRAGRGRCRRRAAASGRRRYRCYRRWPGARRARVRRHPRRAEQVARLVEHDQHRARDGRGAASSSKSRVPSPPVVASTFDHVAPARLLRAEAAAAEAAAAAKAGA